MAREEGGHGEEGVCRGQELWLVAVSLLVALTHSPPWRHFLSSPSQPPRPKPPVPAKPLLSAEACTSPAPRPCRALPSKPCHPIYHEPDEPIAFYAMGRGSPREAPSNIYAEVEVEVGVPPGGKGPRGTLWHSVLRKCRSRPVPGSQVHGVQGKAGSQEGLPDS